MSVLTFVTVVETPEFIRRADELMSDEERAAIVSYLACHPTAGVLVPGAGGIRKVRRGLEGRGKRGGARVVYFFAGLDIPLFALTVFAKNERADLSQDDRNAFRRLTKVLVETYRRRTR